MPVRYRYHNKIFSDFSTLRKQVPHLSFPKPVVQESGRIDDDVVSLFASLGIILEIIEPDIPARTLAQAKAEKAVALKDSFQRALDNARVMSPAGFDVNADEAASRNVNNLIVTMEEDGIDSVSFCDYHNQFHDLSLEDVRSLRRIIARHIQSLYAKKWALRQAIDEAETVEAVDAIETGEF